MSMQDALPEKFAANLRKIRQQRGLSYTVAANKLGCHRKTWIKWETRERSPGLATIQSIAEVLDCSPKTLIS